MNQITFLIAGLLLVSSSLCQAESPVKSDEGVAGVEKSVPVAAQSPVAPASDSSVVVKSEGVQEKPQVYASSSLVGQQNNKPASALNKEQYGQPESAAIPANYKPFGSWGLYIGGNPADGHYTNYYKSLDVPSSVQFGQQQPVVGVSGQQMVSPQSIYKQQSVSPVVSYPHFYSPSDLTSAYIPTSMVSAPQYSPQDQDPMVAPPQYSPVMPEVASFLPDAGHSMVAPPQYSSSVASVSQYAPSTLSKRVRDVGKTSQPKSSGVKGGQQQQQVKGYSPVSALYGSGVISPQPQVVAYSVPVGSQIVGYQNEVAPRQHQAPSQAYDGIHAFTRYAIKPVVVSGEQSSYYQPMPYYAPSVEQPVYKQQAVQYQSPSSYQPFAFYGYPLNQASPSVAEMAAHVAPVVEAPVVPASPVQAGRAQAAPSSPLHALQEQVVQAAPSSPLQAMQEQVAQQVEQVVEQKEAEKSSVKGH